MVRVLGSILKEMNIQEWARAARTRMCRGENRGQRQNLANTHLCVAHGWRVDRRLHRSY